MRRRLVALVVAAALHGVSAPVAHGLVLCASRAGRVSARETCRRKERLLDRAALGLVGPAAQGDPGPGVRIRDRSGRFFGSSLVGGIQAGDSVVVAVGSFFVSIQVDPLVGPPNASFTYEQPACPGQRYYGTEPGGFIRPASGTNPPYYTADPIGPHTQVSIESTNYDPTVCAQQGGIVLGTSCCFPGSGMTNTFLGPATPVDVTSVAVPLEVVVSP